TIWAMIRAAAHAIGRRDPAREWVSQAVPSMSDVSSRETRQLARSAGFLRMARYLLFAGHGSQAPGVLGSFGDDFSGGYPGVWGAGRIWPCRLCSGVLWGELFV